MDNKKTLHMIGNSHIDPVWFWRYSEGLQEVKATFKSALDRMNEFPEFKFTSSSVMYYKWIEEIFPEMFQQIINRVKEDRWHIVGGWWIEPDCNLPSGESFVRQALYSQRYLKEKFGEGCKIGFNVDSFGHNAMLPQLLKKSGMDYYVFMRPNENEKHLKAPLFLWKSIDGSEIPTCRLPGEYTAWFKETALKNIEEAIKQMGDFKEMVCFYGVGNHGGGPTIENINNIYEFRGYENMPQLKLSSLKEFFSNIDIKSLETVEDEMQHHSVGCYSVDSSIKALNRSTEYSLVQTEKLNTMAYMLKPEAHRGKELEKAWEKLLFNQFHDILAGTCIEEAKLDAVQDFRAALSTSDHVRNYSLQIIANSINTQGGEGFPLILFNTKSYSSSEWIEIEIPWDCKWPLTILNENGEEICYQRIRTSCAMINRNFGGRRRVIFKADIPAMGYVIYRVVKKEHSFREELYDNAENVIENEYLRVEFDKNTGNIKSIFDKKSARETLKGEIEARILKDTSDTWGHGIERYDEVIGYFKLESFKKIEIGSNRQGVMVSYKYGTSTLEQFTYLYKDSDYLLVKSILNWQEKHKMFKWAIPVNVANPKFRCEISYGHLDREAYAGSEEFAHSWVNIKDAEDGAGLIIANDSKYGYDLKNNVYSMTIARSPVYAHHIPTEIEEGEYYRYVDQGEQRFAAVLKPHSNCGNIEAARVSDIINKPYDYLIDMNHGGRLNVNRFSFLENSAENVSIEVLKKAEDNKQIIIRLRELEGKETKAKLDINILEKSLEVDIKPFEIKTIRISDNECFSFEELNLIEF